MRFDDRPEVSVTTMVDAEPEAVWPIVSDVDLPARHSPEFVGAEWLDGAEGPAVGARFRGTNEHPLIGRWSTTCTVTTCEPGRSFGWVVNDEDDPVAHWTFTLEPRGTSTYVTFTARLGPGPSGLATAVDQDPDHEERIVRRRMQQWRDNMASTLAGLKVEAEA